MIIHFVIKAAYSQEVYPFLVTPGAKCRLPPKVNLQYQQDLRSYFCVEYILRLSPIQISFGFLFQKEAVIYMEPEKTIISRSGDRCVVALCDQWYGYNLGIDLRV